MRVVGLLHHGFRSPSLDLLSGTERNILSSTKHDEIRHKKYTHEDPSRRLNNERKGPFVYSLQPPLFDLRRSLRVKEKEDIS